jgi:hypothetical protein
VAREKHWPTWRAAWPKNDQVSARRLCRLATLAQQATDNAEDTQAETPSCGVSVMLNVALALIVCAVVTLALAVDVACVVGWVRKRVR